MSLSIVYSQISFFGLYNSIAKFFPLFRNESKDHNGFLLVVAAITLVAFLLITLIYLIFKPVILDFFKDNSSLYIEYYFVLIPLSLFLLLYNIFESLARSIFKTVYAVFLKEFLFRVLTSVLILFYITSILSFENFVFAYIILNGFISLLLMISVIHSGEFSILGLKRKVNARRWREVIKFSSYSFVGSSTYMLAENIDKILIGSYVGLTMVGVYSVFFYIAGVLKFPARAIYRIALPVIAVSWKGDDIKNIQEIYYRSSRLLHIIGSIIFICLMINLNSLLLFFNKTEYGENYMLLILLGFSALIDVTGGINSDIIATSSKFRYDGIFNAVYLIVCIILNFIFIQLYGATGAAIATLVSMFLFKFGKWNFIRVKFKMQPFDLKYFYLISISAVSFLVGATIPAISNIIVDVIVRSAITTIVFFSPIIFFKLDPDVVRIFRNLKDKLNLSS